MRIIVPCLDKEFLNNANEINGYFQAKKKITVINNAPRIINLLNIYYKTLLYYFQNSKNKYEVKINNQLFQFKIFGTDEKGKEKEFDLAETASSLIKNIFFDLKNYIDISNFEKLQETIISILNTKQIPIEHKVLVLNHESESFVSGGDQLMYLISEEIARNAIFHKIEFVYNLIKKPDHQITIDNQDRIYEIYNNLLRSYLRNCVARNHFVDGLKFIYKEIERFDTIDPKIKVDDNKLVFILLNTLCSFNNLFQLEAKERIKETVDDFIHLLDKKNAEIIKENLNFNPHNFEIGSLQIGIADPSFKNIDLESIVTFIQFVIKVRPSKSYSSFAFDNVEIEILELSNLFDDPIYSFLDSSNMQLNGMPVSIFSDSLGDIAESALVRIKINDFFHPEFELVDGDIVPKNFDLENATHGGKYYPHKDFIIEKLFKLLNFENLSIELKKEDVNSNLISNYFVTYHTPVKLLHQQLYTITNFDSYFKTKTKYFEKLNSINFVDSNDVRDFIMNFDILNNKQFLEFSVLLLEKTIKKSIELGGLHSLLWNDSEPKKEVEAQKLIYNQIRFIAEMKGIQISRETVSANGSLDFFFQYTKDSNSLRVCVELKNAHHQNVDKGISTQLPEYIKDTGNRDGIYLVLWYKDKEFLKPNNYDSISDLIAVLDDNIPENYRIKPLIIDCSRFKITPSKK